MTQVFLSHATADDALVRRLQQALALQGIDLWIDSREIQGGAPLWPVVRQAIEGADAYAVLVTPSALQSEWVGDELALALEVQQTRGRERYPVIPLSVDGTRLGVLKRLFGEAPVYIPLDSAPGGIEAALDRVLAALGKRLLADPAPTPQPAAEPVEDLVRELTVLRFCESRILRTPLQTAGRSSNNRARGSSLSPIRRVLRGENVSWHTKRQGCAWRLFLSADPFLSRGGVISY